MNIADIFNTRLLVWRVGASSGSILFGPGIPQLASTYYMFVYSSGNIHVLSFSYG